ncbi:unnamed protein product, partial [Brassica oleracea var. botrytis]
IIPIRLILIYIDSGFWVFIVLRFRLRSSFVTDDVRHVTGSLIRGEGLRHRELSNFRKVVARFNEVVTKLLLKGAIETFKKHSAREEDIQVIWVPDSFEIGVVAQKLGILSSSLCGVPKLRLELEA